LLIYRNNKEFFNNIAEKCDSMGCHSEEKETTNIMGKFGFDTIYTEDNNEYYICIGEKSREA
jgi:hypothetical protein